MRKKRQYGLFIKTKDGRKVRLFPRRSYVKETAVRVFQNLLLDLFFRGKSPELHPLPDPKSVKKLKCDIAQQSEKIQSQYQEILNR